MVLISKAYFLEESSSCVDVKSYTGHVSVTASGRVCQYWSLDFPHHHKLLIHDSSFPEKSIAAAKNFCRDPHNDGFLWCFTTDPGVRWDICNVNLCSKYSCGIRAMLMYAVSI